MTEKADSGKKALTEEQLRELERMVEKARSLRVVGHERHLVICGAGHVSIPIIQIGLMLGFRVTVLEDRPKFANDARNAGATEKSLQRLYPEKDPHRADSAPKC